MNISYVSCKDTNVVAFLIVQITFLEAHLVIGMWLPCSGDTDRWGGNGEMPFFLIWLYCFTFGVFCYL